MGKVRDGIVKRGRTWSYVIRVTDPDTGVSKPKWVGGFATEGDAKEARDEARRAARRGEYVTRSKITVKTYLTGWLDAHAMEIKPRTLAGYRFAIDRYIVPRIGNRILQGLRPSMLTAFYQKLATGDERQPSLSPASINLVHSILRKAFNDAIETDGLISLNPALKAKRPRVAARKQSDIWTAKDLKVFLAEAADHRLFAFYRLAAYTGARRGELLNLRWADVDWSIPAIWVRGSVAVIEGDRVEGTPKSGHDRLISLDSETVNVLKGHRRRQMRDMRTMGTDWPATGHVFTRENGMPIHPDSPTELFMKIIRRYNAPHVPGRPDELLLPPDYQLPPARLHDLRHLHATMLLMAGVPVHVVSERLGHADASITLKVYAHVIRRRADGVADTFADAVEADDETRDDDDDDGLAEVPC